MTRFLDWMEWVVVATWFGSMVFVSFVAAPVAFNVLDSQADAGRLVGETLDRFYLLTYIACSLIAVTTILKKQVRKRSARPSYRVIMLLAIILGLNVYAREVVATRLVHMRRQHGNIQKLDIQDPRKLAFDRLHQRSVQLMGGSLAVGLLLIYVVSANQQRREVSH